MSGRVSGLDIAEALATTDAYGAARTEDVLAALTAIENGALAGVAKRQTNGPEGD